MNAKLFKIIYDPCYTAWYSLDIYLIISTVTEQLFVNSMVYSFVLRYVLDLFTFFSYFIQHC